MDVPSAGGVITHNGMWDLRGRYDDYLYGAHLKGKSVLDVGAASGWISFEAEHHGAAEVVSLDMADDVRPQYVPYAFLKPQQTGVLADNNSEKVQTGIKRGDVRKAYWYCHEQYGSKAKAVYGDAHAIGNHIFGADVVILGQVLVHQRDPLSVIHECAKIANETLVIVEGCFESDQPLMTFWGLNGNFYSWSTSRRKCINAISTFSASRSHQCEKALIDATT
jgi:hypothetical protein